MAEDLQIELDSLQFDSFNRVRNATAQEFQKVILAIRKHLDPHFRLISNGASIETHFSNPSWKIALSAKWLQEEMDKPQYLVSKLASCQKQMAAGFAKKEDQGFNFIVVSKINKGITTKKHIEEKLQKFPEALVVTIGDTQLDFPMHKNAHLAFHVGLEHVWRSNILPQCVMICDQEGRDSQHINGTLKVLKFLEEAIGKSFYDFKHIRQQNSSLEWDYYSIRELQ